MRRYTVMVDERRDAIETVAIKTDASEGDAGVPVDTYTAAVESAEYWQTAYDGEQRNAGYWHDAFDAERQFHLDTNRSCNRWRVVAITALALIALEWAVRVFVYFEGSR
jgi:hypothetical protein